METTKGHVLQTKEIRDMVTSSIVAVAVEVAPERWRAWLGVTFDAGPGTAEEQLVARKALSEAQARALFDQPLGMFDPPGFVKWEYSAK